MEEVYKLFLESVPCPIWIKSIDGKFIYVNRPFEELYEVMEKDVIGKYTFDIFSKEMATTYEENTKKVIKTKETMSFEGLIGGVYKSCFIFPFFNDDHIIIGCAGLIIDVNEQKEREFELQTQKSVLRTIIDSIPDVIFYKDRNSQYIGCNKQCSDFYKEKGINDIIGKTDMDINENKQLAQSFIEKDLELMDKKASEYTEARFIKSNGEVEIMECVKVPVIDEDGEVWGIVGVSRDITKNKKLEERLRFLSYTDALTGLYNRSKFEERIQELNKDEYLPLGLIMGDLNGLKLVNDTFGHVEGDKMLKEMAQVLKHACGEQSDIFRWGGDEFVILLPNTCEVQCEKISATILEQCKEYELELMKLSISLGIAVKNTLDIHIDEIIKEAEDNVYRQKLLMKKSVRSNIITSLQKSLQEKNMETEQHTERLVNYALAIGKAIGLKQFELDELVLVTKLHDIGKIGISEEILLKPGKLTDEEYEIMKTHTEKGYRIVQATGGLNNVAIGVLTHHERWDGKGYPLGLKEEEIPLNARIVCVVDAYDAMTSDRVYQKAISKENAINELLQCSGSQFDSNIVDIFIRKVLNS